MYFVILGQFIFDCYIQIVLLDSHEKLLITEMF